MKNLYDMALNSDMLNKLIDGKLEQFQIFIVKDESDTKYYLHLRDKNSNFTLKLAEFKTYKQYLRWFSEAAIMRTCASAQQIKKVRQIYKKLFFAARDPSRVNPLEKDE